MDFLVFYIFSLIYLNNNNLNIENYKLNEDKKIINTAKQLNSFIENNKTLKTVTSKKIRTLLAKNNVYSYQILPFIHQIDNNKLSDDIKIFLSLNSKNYNKAGYYYGKKYLIIILVNELLKLNINPSKKRYNQYQYINIKGNNIENHIKLFSLYINPPSNKIKKILLPIINNKFSFKYKLKEKGKYIFEIVSENPNDPQIISKIRINTGNNKIDKICNNNIKNKTELLHDINRIRKTNGLRKLEELYPLSKIAYKHSKDMAENNFFSHISSKGKSPYQRIKNSKIKFKKISENISQAPQLCIAHNEILESPGHLKNLLDNKVNKIGLGIYKKNDLFYLTEDFILFTQKSLKEYSKIFYKQISNFNINNNSSLNRVAKMKNYNEYYIALNIPKKLPIYINRFKKIKSYFFIVNNIDSTLINEINDIEDYSDYGYNISKFNLDNKTYLFLTVILADL